MLFDHKFHSEQSKTVVCFQNVKKKKKKLGNADGPVLVKVSYLCVQNATALEIASKKSKKKRRIRLKDKSPLCTLSMSFGDGTITQKKLE